MGLRKAIVFGAVVFALAVLSPVSALADTEGARCPVMGSGSGTASLNLPTLTFTSDATGLSSCAGLVTGHSEGSGAFNADGTFHATGTQTAVGANGEELVGTITLDTSDVTLTTHTTTVVMTITGGTGRNAGASGTITTISHVKFDHFDPATGTAYNTFDYTSTGEITY
jgi:hypothetical protein